MIDLFCKTYYSHKRASSEMFDRVLNAPLIVIKNHPSPKTVRWSKYAFRTQSNIYGGAFFKKLLTVFSR